MDQTIIFSLDLFLDTRLTTLGIIDSDIPVRILENKSDLVTYSTRPNDKFTEFGLTENQFAEEYAKRSVTTLMASRPTRFFYDIRKLAKDIIGQNVESPFETKNINFVINTYPYSDLTEEESELILDAIYCHVPDIIKMSTTYLSPTSLSPKYLKDLDATGVFMYDIAEWLGIHYGESCTIENLVENPQMTITSPILFNDLDMLKKANEFENPDGVRCDFVKGFKTCFASLFTFNPVNTMLVSIITPKEVVALTEALAEEALRYAGKDNKGE